MRNSHDSFFVCSLSFLSEDGWMDGTLAATLHRQVRYLSHWASYCRPRTSHPLSELRLARASKTPPFLFHFPFFLAVRSDVGCRDAEGGLVLHSSQAITFSLRMNWNSVKSLSCFPWFVGDNQRHQRNVNLHGIKYVSFCSNSKFEAIVNSKFNKRKH